MTKRYKITRILFLTVLSLFMVLVACTFYAVNRPGIIILMYHKIDHAKPEAKIKGLYVSPEKFERQILMLQKFGYTFISYKDYLQNRNDPNYFEKKVMITLDDGYRDNYTKLFPIVKKYKIPVHIFMIIDAIGAEGYTKGGYKRENVPENMLTADQIKEMSDSGLVFFGSHCIDHIPVTKFTRKERIRQLTESKIKLEAITGKPVDIFAFPIGFYDGESIIDVGNSGYLMSFTTDEGRNFPDTGLLRLNRIGIAGWYSQLDILKKIFVTAL